MAIILMVRRSERELKDDNIHVYVFCNPPKALKDVITEGNTGFNRMGDAIAGFDKIWEKGNFY
ncbi:MAG: hypothetical protein ACLSDJ_06630 [Butyricimonas faecihominis]